MNTHLSEASVNSLLSLVKGANTSGSYDDKINILTKAGVLHGGQKYSSRVAGPGAPAAVETVTAGGTVVDVDTGLAGLGAQQTRWWTAAAIAAYMAQGKTLIQIAKAYKALYPYDLDQGGRTPWGYFVARKPVPQDFLSRAREVARDLDRAKGPLVTDSQDVLQQVVRNGFLTELRLLLEYTKSTNPDATLLADILLFLALIPELFSIIVEDLIMEGPNYLSTIPDGNYSFTFYPQSGAGAGNLTGTAVINSQKEIYSGILVQKLINSKIAGTPPITVLQTLDASFSSRQIDTSGSSYNGKYTVVGNTATITSNGYSKEAGAFVETVTTITTYPAGFFVNNSIVNPDNSYTPISLIFYTRQLTSAEKENLSHLLISMADIDGNQKLSFYEFREFILNLISQGFNMVDLDEDGLINASELKPALGQLEAVITGLVQAYKERQPLNN